MTAKEYLNMPSELNKKIESDMKKLEIYRDLASSISSPQLGERVQGTRSVDPPFVRYLGKIDELEREIAKEKQELANLKLQIDAQIDKLDSETEQLVLRYRYLLFMNMPEIADKIHYTKRRAQQIHKKAIENFEKDFTPFHPFSSLSHPLDAV